MQELEIKILEVDVEEITKKLINLGAQKIFSGKIEAEFFDFPDKRLQNSGKLLRLRRKGDICELVIKEKLSVAGVKAAHETEVQVSDFNVAKELLLHLGVEVVDVRPPKERVSYDLGNGVHVEFDTFEGVPTFIEVESEDVKAIEETVKKLGYTMADVKTWDGYEVLKYYKNKKIPT